MKNQVLQRPTKEDIGSTKKNQPVQFNPPPHIHFQHAESSVDSVCGSSSVQTFYAFIYLNFPHILRVRYFVLRPLYTLVMSAWSIRNHPLPPPLYHITFVPRIFLWSGYGKGAHGLLLSISQNIGQRTYLYFVCESPSPVVVLLLILGSCSCRIYSRA